MDVIDFVKNHPTLCLLTLGAPVVGYLGLRAVLWVFDLCPLTAKLSRVAKEFFSIGASSNSHSLSRRVSDLSIPEGRVSQGHGEYVVFHKSKDNQCYGPSRKLYDRIYDIIDEHTPAAIVERQERVEERLNHRFESMRSKIKDLDPSLDIVFIPRVLYELNFLRKCITEDMRRGKICSKIGEKNLVKEKPSNFPNWFAPKNKCWHRCCFDTPGDNRDGKLKELAFRLNKAIVKNLPTASDGCTFKELTSLLKREIAFFKEHHKVGEEARLKARKEPNETNDFPYNMVYPGPTLNFGCDEYKCNISPMGITNDQDEKIIEDVMRLECSDLARDHFLLYRGTNAVKDVPFDLKQPDQPYSLSYGSSLYAGSVYDGGATAAFFFKKSKNGSVMAIPHQKLNRSVFFIPKENALYQLLSYGEIFHGRTKIWKDHDPEKIDGMNTGGNGQQRQHLISSIPKKEFIDEFNRYRSSAVSLK